MKEITNKEIWEARMNLVVLGWNWGVNVCTWFLIERYINTYVHRYIDTHIPMIVYFLALSSEQEVMTSQ